MAALVYILCALTALACATLLFRSFIRNRVTLLFWSGICFSLLFVNNALLYIDKELILTTDLARWRGLSGLAGVASLLYGLIREQR